MSEPNTVHKSRTITVHDVVLTVALFVPPAIPVLLTTVFPPIDHHCGPTDGCTETQQAIAYIGAGSVALLSLSLAVTAWTCPPRSRTVMLVVALLVSLIGSGVCMLMKPWYIP